MKPPKESFFISLANMYCFHKNHDHGNYENIIGIHICWLILSGILYRLYRLHIQFLMKKHIFSYLDPYCLELYYVSRTS